VFDTTLDTIPIAVSWPRLFRVFFGVWASKTPTALSKPIGITEIRVNVRKLNTILQLHAPDLREIGVISIDVEEWEMEVLIGIDVAQYKPRFTIIENLFNHEAYWARLKSLGYLLGLYPKGLREGPAGTDQNEQETNG
jgi:hypothetical protein